MKRGCCRKANGVFVRALAWCLVPVLWAMFVNAAQDDVLNIGVARHLFADDRLVDVGRTRGVARTLNPPQDVRRVLVPDQPWETLGFIFYSSVVDAGDSLRLYYGSYSYDGQKKVRHFCLATSRDGLRWERPALGVRAFGGSTSNNLLPVTSFDGAVFVDPHAQAEKRYRLLMAQGMDDPANGGLFVASSPDGVSWARAKGRVLPFVPDSQHAAFWDERLHKYVAYLRSWQKEPRRRQVCRIEADDLDAPWLYDESVPPFEIWGEGKTPTLSREFPVVLAADAGDPDNLDIYTSAAQAYPYAPGVYFAFPAAYFKFVGPDWASRKVSGNDGLFEVQFAASADGVAWTRWREPYVAAGFHDGLDLRLVSLTHGMVRRGRWIWQYFVGWPHTHGRPDVWDKEPANSEAWIRRDRGGIYAARQRLDGFVSLDSAYAGGVLTTKPLAFSGKRLRLNLDTRGTGSAKVSLLDSEGQPLPGFSEEACEIINADDTDYAVRWKGGGNVSALTGKPVRVKISMRNTKLYAIQFADD